MGRDVLLTDNKELCEVRARKRLPISRGKWRRGDRLLLLSGERLWGPWRVEHRSDEGYFLRKLRGRPVFFWRPEKGPLKASEIEECFFRFRGGNCPPREILFHLDISGEKVRRSWSATHFESLVHLGEDRGLEAPGLLPVQPRIAQSNRGDHPMGVRDEMRRAGRELGALVSSGAPEMKEGDRVRYQVPHECLPQGVYEGGFWGLTRRLVRHKCPHRGIGRGLLPRRGIGLVASGWNPDGGMASETDRLKRLWNWCGRPLTVRQGRLEQEGLSRMLEQVRLFHFTGHGSSGAEGAGMRLGEGRVFDRACVLRLARAPAFVFLSCCGDMPENFIDAWFARGTRCLIYPRGPLKSETMAAFSASYYWNWMHRREGADAAFLAARRRFGRTDWNWFYLEMAGDPDLKF